MFWGMYVWAGGSVHFNCIDELHRRNVEFEPKKGSAGKRISDKSVVRSFLAYVIVGMSNKTVNGCVDTPAAHSKIALVLLQKKYRK